VREKLSRTRQDQPWGSHSLIHNGSRVFDGKSGRDVASTIIPPLAPRLKKEYGTLIPFWTFRVCCRANLPLTPVLGYYLAIGTAFGKQITGKKGQFGHQLFLTQYFHMKFPIILSFDII
jgi:hypothetical protein